VIKKPPPHLDLHIKTIKKISTKKKKKIETEEEEDIYIYIYIYILFCYLVYLPVFFFFC
jgi:hypothetical protein